jgi:hypothetical protein
VTLHNEKLSDSFRSPGAVRTVKSRRLWKAAFATRMAGTGNGFSVDIEIY